MREGLKPIAQFSPDLNNEDIPGAYGWGFITDDHKYKIIMYRPSEFDTQKTIAIDERRDEALKTIDRRKKTKTGDRKKNKEGDHGPAHVHVIEIASHRESKFELVQHVDQRDNTVEFLPTTNLQEIPKVPLEPEEMADVIPMLKEYSNDFIQLWHETYHENRRGHYVTRMSEKDEFPDHYERIFFKKVQQATTDGRGNFHKKEPWVELIDKEGTKTILPFEKYKALKAQESLARR